jgi:hypothetical protein
MAVRPQACVELVVVGDGDYVEIAAQGDVIEHFLNGCQSITGGGMHMQISAPAKHHSFFS